MSKAFIGYKNEARGFSSLQKSSSLAEIEIVKIGVEGAVHDMSFTKIRI